MSISFDVVDAVAPALSMSVYVVADTTRPGPSFTSVAALPRLQRVAERWGVVPTYLVPFTALGHRELRHRLLDWSAAGRVEVGALLELDDETTGDADALQGSLERLSRAIEETLHLRPVTLAIRGRRTTAELADAARAQGYSVLAVDAEETRCSTDALLRVPVTTTPGSTRQLLGRFARRLGAPAGHPLRAPSLDLTTESGARTDQVLDQLVGRLVDRVHVSCSTPELCLGCGERAVDAHTVERTFRRIERVLRRAREELRAVPRPLCEAVFVPAAGLRTRAPLARRRSAEMPPAAGVRA